MYLERTRTRQSRLSIVFRNDKDGTCFGRKVGIKKEFVLTRWINAQPPQAVQLPDRVVGEVYWRVRRRHRGFDRAAVIAASGAIGVEKHAVTHMIRSLRRDARRGVRAQFESCRTKKAVTVVLARGLPNDISVSRTLLSCLFAQDQVARAR